jgi:hypothetical protein
MTLFDHNAHQVASAKDLAQQLGFIRHDLIDHGRNNSPVFNKQKQLVHVIGKVSNTDFESLWESRYSKNVVIAKKPPSQITCKAQAKRELYISSTGDVYPCCFMGYYPGTFEQGMNTYHGKMNQELESLVTNNNALKYDLETCIQWFNTIAPTWDADPLRACNDHCGANSPFARIPT